MRASSTKFARQLTVDRIVATALKAVDKPEAFRSDPQGAEGALWRLVERYPDRADEARARVAALVALNPRDWVAESALHLLDRARGESLSTR